MPRLYLFLILFLLSCHQPPTAISGWQKVYKNDPEGHALFGEKAQLLDAVRLGYPIRIGWGTNRIEHVAPANFLTIFDGKEVFAQIKTIVGQQPMANGDSLKIRFRTNNHWVKMAGTNGYTTGFMTDYLQDTIAGGGMDRTAATTWYVDYPVNPPKIEAQPLWRAGSPNWDKAANK